MTAASFQLLDDEHVLWEGSPPRGWHLYARDRELIPFSLAWGGFFIVGNAAVWTRGGDWVLRFWFFPFLLIGLYVLVGRFVVDAWVRRRQRYVVTNRRILILRHGWGGGIRSVDLDWMPFVKMTEHADGSGDLRFAPPRTGKGKWGRVHERDLWAPALSPTPQFLGVPDVAATLDLIRRAAPA